MHPKTTHVNGRLRVVLVTPKRGEGCLFFIHTKNMTCGMLIYSSAGNELAALIIFLYSTEKIKNWCPEPPPLNTPDILSAR